MWTRLRWLCVPQAPIRIGSAARSGFVGSWRIPGSGCLDRADGFEIAHHGPEKPDELAGHRDDRDLRPLPIRQVIVLLMWPLLGLPGVRDDGGGLALLPPLQIDARLRTMPITPRR